MTAHPTTADAQAGIQRAVVAAATALPWLNPFAPGPSTNVVPWLISFACGVAVWAMAVAHGARLRTGLLALFAGALLWTVAWTTPSPSDGMAWAGGLLLIVLAASSADVATIARGVRDGLMVAAAASAAMALVQYIGAAALFAPWVSYASAGEAYANLRQPNQFATLCAIGLATVVWSGAFLSRGVRIALVALLAAGTAASVSRTGLVQLVVLAVLGLWWPGADRRDRALLVLVGLGAYFAASSLLPLAAQWWTGSMPARTLLGRLGSAEGCHSRLVLWRNVVHLVGLHPWTGWGLGELDYAHFMTLYEGSRFCEILDNAHNMPLQLAVEMGLPAAVFACGGIVAWALGQRPWSEASDDRRLAWTLLAVIALHSLLEYPLWYGPFQIAAGFAVGLLTCSGGRWQSPVPRAAIGTACMAGAVAIGWAAWDYARVSQIYLPPEQRVAAWRDDPLGEAARSWLFRTQAQFAALTLTTPTRGNAAELLPQARALLHYSPEPRVAERAIEAAVYLGKDDEAAALLARYRAAFPSEAAEWLRGHAQRRQD